MTSPPAIELDPVTQAVAVAALASGLRIIGQAGRVAAVDPNRETMAAFRDAGCALLAATSRARRIRPADPLLAELYATMLDRCALAANIASREVFNPEAFDRATTGVTQAFETFAETLQTLNENGQ